jgi:hypothetical protein
VSSSSFHRHASPAWSLASSKSSSLSKDAEFLTALSSSSSWLPVLGRTWRLAPPLANGAIHLVCELSGGSSSIVLRRAPASVSPMLML